VHLGRSDQNGYAAGMRNRHCLLVLAVLSSPIASGCSIFHGPIDLMQSGTIVVKPDMPFFVTFRSKWPVNIELEFENRGPGTLEIRESLPDSKMHTVTPSGHRMSVKEETDRIEWTLTSDDEAVANFRFTSDGGGSLSIGPK